MISADFGDRASSIEGEAAAGRPLATLLLLTYQQERYVRDAVRGALAQTYRPLQIIISDDCSTDGTMAVIQDELRDYAGPHRVVVNRNPTRLVHHHIGAIMPAVEGDYLVLACGDDECLPDRVAVTVAAHQRTGADVITANSEVIDAAGGLLGLFRDPKEEPDLSLERFVVEPTAMCHGASMSWSMELWRAFGPVEEIRTFDWVIPFWGLLRGGNFFISEPLLRYRVHTGNTALGILATQAEGPEKRAVVAELQAYQETANIVAMLRAVDRLEAMTPDDPRLPSLRAGLSERLNRAARRWTAARWNTPSQGVGFF